MFQADDVVPTSVAGPAPQRRQRESKADRSIVYFFHELRHPGTLRSYS